MKVLSIPRILPANAQSSPAAARRRRKIPCSHCREPLLLPGSAESLRRTPILYCPRCAHRTPVPTLRRRLIQITGILFVIAAWVFVIFTWLREG